MNNFIERMLPIVLCLFLFVYTGYQFMRGMERAPYATEVALNYTVEDAVKSAGVIVRDEHVIDDRAVGGAVSYTRNDGAMVTEYTTIAEVYNRESDIAVQKQIRALDLEIASLKRVSDKRSAEYSNTDRLNQQLAAALDDLIQTADSGMVSSIADKRGGLVFLLGQKAVATGRAENFESRIAQLEAERDGLVSRLSGEFTEYKSPEKGYFARMIDGYEGVLTPDYLQDMTVAQLEELTGERVSFDNHSFGKIVVDYNWDYAALVSQRDGEKFKEGAEVYLNFNMYGLSRIPFTVQEVRHDDTSEKTAVILRTDYMVPELLMVRNPSAEIQFKSYSGLRIPKRAKRYEGQQSGVYVLDGDTIRFKTINIIYETDTFILCGPNPDIERPLELFDQVIVEGTDLKDGKTIG